MTPTSGTLWASTRPRPTTSRGKPPGAGTRQCEAISLPDDRDAERPLLRRSLELARHEVATLTLIQAHAVAVQHVEHASGRRVVVVLAGLHRPRQLAEVDVEQADLQHVRFCELDPWSVTGQSWGTVKSPGTAQGTD